VNSSRAGTVTPADARAAEYVLAFGPPVDVHVNGGIDVFVHGPRRGLPGFSTLLTSGMSDTRMSAPDDAGLPITRAELVLYARSPAVEHAELLRSLASLPAKTGAWFGLYHVVSLDGRLFLLAPPPVDASVESPFDEPLAFLWPIPLADSEALFLVEHGHARLMDRLYGAPGRRPECLLVDEPRDPVA
jgi:hypothetical protein